MCCALSLGTQLASLPSTVHLALHRLCTLSPADPCRTLVSSSSSHAVVFAAPVTPSARLDSTRTKHQGGGTGEEIGPTFAQHCCHSKQQPHPRRLRLACSSQQQHCSSQWPGHSLVEPLRAASPSPFPLATPSSSRCNGQRHVRRKQQAVTTGETQQAITERRSLFDSDRLQRRDGQTGDEGGASPCLSVWFVWRAPCCSSSKPVGTTLF